MTVKIHGKDYKTVVERVNEFWEHRGYDDYGIHTELLEFSPETVVVQARIIFDGRVVGSGLAFEDRDSSKINKTSYVENCETSAIGRALASIGLGGEEYASADEVQQAIRQQEEATDKQIAEMKEDVLSAVERSDWGYLCRLDRADSEVWKETWKRLGSKVRARIKELQQTKDNYLTQLNDAAAQGDGVHFKQLVDELSKDDARYLYRIINQDAQIMLAALMEEGNE